MCVEVCETVGNFPVDECEYFKDETAFREVRRGYWIKRGNEKKCSVCEFIYYSNNDEWNGCPNCLAEMNGNQL